MPQYRGKIQSLSVSQDGQEVSLAADIMGGERLRLVFPALQQCRGETQLIGYLDLDPRSNAGAATLWGSERRGRP
jgi:hypothetical protein